MLTSLAEFKSFVESKPKCGVLFVAPKHPASERMLKVVEALEAELSVPFSLASVTDFSIGRKGLGVICLPTLWLVREGKLARRLEVADPPAYYAAAMEVYGEAASPSGGEDLTTLFAAAEKAMKEHAEGLVKRHNILVFGDNESANAAANDLLERGLAESEFVDVGVTSELGRSLSMLTSIPPPVVFVEGEALSLADFRAKLTDAAFIERLTDLDTKSREALETEIRALIKKAPVMLFMKGSKVNPFCKFSREMVRLLNEAKIDFDYFDIFQDNRIRETLKRLSDWPTYPQLYIRGELVGGLDVLKETIADAGGIDMLKKELRL